MRPVRRSLTPLLVLAAVVLSACSAGAPPVATGGFDAKPSPLGVPIGDDAFLDGDDEDLPGGLDEALDERDAFFEAQQQVPGDADLVAKTPEQKELVAQQRAYVESQGGLWTADAERITLALGLDACETSILNGHAVDAEVFEAHIESSPLIQAVSGSDPDAKAGAVSIMVFGTGFLCPDDAPQWETAWQEWQAG